MISTPCCTAKPAMNGAASACTYSAVFEVVASNIDASIKISEKSDWNRLRNRSLAECVYQTYRDTVVGKLESGRQLTKLVLDLESHFAGHHEGNVVFQVVLGAAEQFRHRVFCTGSLYKQFVAHKNPGSIAGADGDFFQLQHVGDDEVCVDCGIPTKKPPFAIRIFVHDCKIIPQIVTKFDACCEVEPY